MFRQAASLDLVVPRQRVVGGLACVASLLVATASHAQIDTIINVPPDVAPNEIGSNTQLNLFDNGTLPEWFQAGTFGGSSTNVEVNIFGGTVGRQFQAVGGSRVEIFGGVFGKLFDTRGGQVTIHGSEFLLDGLPIEPSVVTLTETEVLTGTLADGTPFIFSTLPGDILVGEHDLITGTTLATTTVPPIDVSPITVDSENAPRGLRAGQSLTLEDDGVLGDFFAAVNATLNVSGGVVGEGMEVAGAQVAISGGAVGNGFDAFAGSRVTVSGGSVGDQFRAFDSQVVISSEAVVERLRAFGGSQVTVTDGTLIDGFGAEPGSHVIISGGSIGGHVVAYDGSAVSISGGTFGDSFFASGGRVELYGTEFALDGGEITELALGDTVPIDAREVELTALLADGTALSINLTEDFSLGGDYFSTLATLNVTRVSLLDGDYNSNGTVDQADLDLVLLNWGEELFNPFSAGWFNDLPDGQIDQGELDAVLLNWGRDAPLGANAVPEPSSVVLALLLAVATAVAVLTSKSTACGQPSLSACRMTPQAKEPAQAVLRQ